MRREERVTVQGSVKEQQPDGMSHRGGGGQACAVLPLTAPPRSGDCLLEPRTSRFTDCPHIVVPSLKAMDRIIVTPRGQTPPTLGVNFPVGDQEAALKALPSNGEDFDIGLSVCGPCTAALQCTPFAALEAAGVCVVGPSGRLQRCSFFTLFVPMPPPQYVPLPLHLPLALSVLLCLPLPLPPRVSAAAN